MPLFWLLAMLLMPLVVVVAATVLCVVVVVYLFNIALFYALEQTLHWHVVLHE